MRWIVSVGLVAAVVAVASPKWDTEFRERFVFLLSVKFANLPGGEAIAACMASELERDVSQEEMEKFMSGTESGDLGPRVFKRCACDVVKVPEALAEPGFCRAPGSVDI